MAHTEIQGYKFTTEDEGQDAQQSLNDYYSIPAYPNAETTQYSSLCYPTINNEYYMYAAEGMIEVLGEPETIILEEEPPE